jgi:hypothetical protein
MTLIETRLISNVTSRGLTALSEAWANVKQLSVLDLATESNPQLVQIVPPNEVVVEMMRILDSIARDRNIDRSVLIATLSRRWCRRPEVLTTPSIPRSSPASSTPSPARWS